VIRSTEELISLVEMYTGDFLTGIELPGEETSAWIMVQRTIFRERYLELALTAVQQLGSCVPDDVLRRLAEEAPYDDRPVRARMILHRSSSAAVYAIYRSFVDRLDRELNGAPEPETHALVRELAPAKLPPSLRVAAVHVPTASRSSIPRVLILPPAENLALLELDDQRLGWSLIDEITHSLSRMKTFAVFAPFTARQLAAAPFPQGNPYGVDYLVTTRLLPTAGAVVRLAATLTSISTHEVLLSEEMRFVPDELGAHHLHLAAGIASGLARGIGDQEIRQFRATGLGSAYVHYLLGCDEARSLELKPIRRARNHFKQALRLSPQFALSRAMLAFTYSWEWLLLDRPDKAPLQQAIEFASQAIRDDPLDPIGHREMGNAALYLDRTDEALEHLKSAVSLGPHDADVLFNYADLLMHLGHNQAAAVPMDRALELNPLAPDLYFWINGTIRYFLEDYDAAAISFNKMKQPDAASRARAAVEAMRGNRQVAKSLRDSYMARHPEFRLANFMIPLKDPIAREHYLQGLRSAGFS
jgi:Tfp pilus assembly protein PilF/TolB-like protein